MRIALQIPFIILLCLTLSNCSKDEDTKAISGKFFPDQPNVFNAGFSYKVGSGDTATTVEIGGPWFQVGYHVDNNSSKDLTIMSMTFHITGQKANGQTAVGDSEFTVGDLTVNIDDDQTNDQLYLAYIPKGASFDFSRIFIHSLPNKKDDQVLTYNFIVSAEIEGWFGTPFEPEKSFRQNLLFTTKD